MNRDEWIARAKARYMERAKLDDETAQGAAEHCWDETGSAVGGEPEAAADEDMSYWTADE